MKSNKISLLSIVLACCVNMPVEARINMKSSNNTTNYVQVHNQMTSLRNQQIAANQQVVTTASDVGNLPVAVDDENLMRSVLAGTSQDVSRALLESCSMIYPTGVFRWGIPDSGIRKTPVNQCVAVVELRDVNNVVLATTTLASGDSMKCNIDMFPTFGQYKALESVELPADKKPTMEDVEAVMNEEQKQNAGLKIAAAAIISGVAGNMLAPKEAGDTKLMGTGKTQLLTTAGSAAAGAGIMAASTYSGKVAGDTIKSTAVNATAGMVVGNMTAGMSGSGSVLNTTKCTVNKTEYDCVIGKMSTLGDETINIPSIEQNLNNKPTNKNVYFINRDRTEILKCEINYTKNEANTWSTSSDDDRFVVKSCTSSSGLVNIKVKGYNKLFKEAKSSDYSKMQKYIKSKEDGVDEIHFELNNTASENDSNLYFLIESASVSKSDRVAYAVFSSPLPVNMSKITWADLQQRKPTYYERNSDGSVSDTPYAVDDNKHSFEPMYKDAEDGGLIDMSNQARTKGTLIGTAVGGGMGGFSGYQGAKQEVAERWTEAVRVYEDSLSNFYCATGNRYLGKYNDYIEIPDISIEQQ